MNIAKSETIQTRAGYTTKSFVPPLYMTAGYVYDSAMNAQEIFELKKAGNIYSRHGNPATAIVTIMEAGRHIDRRRRV